MSCVNKQYSVIQLRRGSQADFVSSNIVLASGEPAYAVDEKLFKVGDGVTPWNDLETINTSGSYFITSSGNTLTVNTLNAISGLFTFVSGQSILTDYIQFNTAASPTITQGRIYWNDTEGTANVGLTNNTAIHIGEHSFFRIRNETGSPLYKGQAVYATGVHANGIIHPAKYTGNGGTDEIRFMGLVLEQVNDNNNGYAIQFGHIENIDTRGNVASDIAVGDETWADGDILYAHPTVAGKLTNVKPKHAISVAIVLDAANNGRLFVRPTNFGDLDDNHDVDLTGISDGKFLQYNSSTGYWVPSSSGNFSELFINGVSVPDSTYVNGLLAANDAMIFKGTLGSGGTITSLPSIYNAGWSYKVITAGTYAGNVCEVGDLIIAIVDRPSGSGLNSDWVVVQTNIDGAVSTGGGTTNYLSKFSSSTTLSNSIVYDNGTNVGINQTSPTQRLHVVGSGYFDGGLRVDNIKIKNNSISPVGSSDDIAISGSAGGIVSINSSGKLILKSDLPNGDHVILQPGQNKNIIASGNVLCLGSDASYSSDVTITTSGSKDLILNTNGGTNSANLIIEESTTGNVIVSGYPTGTDLIFNIGQGAIQGTVNGNARGNYANDFQRSRSSDSEIAAGDYSVICGGEQNSVPYQLGAIVGGRANAAWEFGFIGGGYNNRQSTATNGYYNAIAGGYGNEITASTSNPTNAPNSNFIGGGNTNVIYESYGSVIGGGYSNYIYGQTSAPYANYSTIPGGYEAKTTDRAQLAYANGKFDYAGDAQYSLYILKTKTSSSGMSSLYLDYDSGSGSDETITMPYDCVATFIINISGRSESSGDSAGFIIRGCIKSVSNSVAFVGSPVIESFLDSNFSSGGANAEVDTSSGYFKIRVNQGSSVGGTVRWIATVQVSRVTYGGL